MRSTGMPPPKTQSRRDRSQRLPASAEEEDRHEDEEEHEPHKPVDKRKRRRNGIWLTFVALLLAAWTATMFINSTSPLVTAPSAVMPLVTICALPVIAIGVGGKHFVSTGIAAIAALLPWAMVAGYASSREAPVGKTVTVRVMSVDGSLGRANANAVAAAAKTYAADVVVITGLSSTLAHGLTVAGLDRQLPPLWVQVPSNQNTGIGIYSRLAISDLTSVDGLSRPAASGVLQADGARVGLTVAQIGGGTLFPAASRSADLKKLAAQKVAGASTGSFLVGSLNTTPWQPGFHSLEKAGWEDAADVTGKGLRPTWPSWSPLPITPADHLLVDQKIGVASTATVNIGGSSHRALVVSLEVPTG